MTDTNFRCEMLHRMKPLLFYYEEAMAAIATMEPEIDNAYKRAFMKAQRIISAF